MSKGPGANVAGAMGALIRQMDERLSLMKMS